MNDWRAFGNWKLIDPAGQVLLKVVGFPRTDGRTESMWVIVTAGTDYAGTGTLDNVPDAVPWLELGAQIRYGNGTDSRKPEYLGPA